MEEQALRETVIQETVSATKVTETVRLQKAVYFMQEAWGVPTGYPIKTRHYGPTPDRLEKDMARLESTGRLKVGPNPYGPGTIATLTEGTQPDWEPFPAAVRQAIEETAASLASWSTIGLRIAATLHHLENWSTPGGVPGRSAQEDLPPLPQSHPGKGEEYPHQAGTIGTRGQTRRRAAKY